MACTFEIGLFTGMIYLHFEIVLFTGMIYFDYVRSIRGHIYGSKRTAVINWCVANARYQVIKMCCA